MTVSSRPRASAEGVHGEVAFAACRLLIEPVCFAALAAFDGLGIQHRRRQVRLVPGLDTDLIAQRVVNTVDGALAVALRAHLVTQQSLGLPLKSYPGQTGRCVITERLG
ncbi:hypothetical protein [Saccharopolyspora spinosa]|uniref:Uncharacterized protein n=1 Tax=Saccharopolyspora spinosa TaxID=60894 RepID=A0A2N3Y6A4_SACSN|nr:hypothetical protein [Saccharopolyspora spinosa]PKW18449.1 hypothetical protein A8926_6531 [Saccharopolyspora spinosa]